MAVTRTLINTVLVAGFRTVLDASLPTIHPHWWAEELVNLAQHGS